MLRDIKGPAGPQRRKIGHGHREPTVQSHSCTECVFEPSVPDVIRRVYRDGWRRGHPDVRGKTMNGSAQSGKPSIVLHGVGVQAGASACWRRAGRRCRREAAVAAHWRMGPAAGGPTNSFFACSENWIDSSHAPRSSNSRAMFRHAQDDGGCGRDSLDASCRNRRRAPACTRYPGARAPPVLNLIVRVGAWREERVPTARAGSASFASIGA